MQRAVWLVGIVIATTVLVGCGGLAAPATSPSPTPTPALTPRPPDMPLETPPPVTDIPQSILDPILDEAANLSGLPREQLTIERAEAVVWNDGSLGCPQPGEFYTQALVNGYWVVMKAGEQTYDFRVGSGGSFKLCPPGQGNPPVDAPDVY